jgi:hypothetical protein
MTPATVHLNAQLIRHGRGICTAFEKWVAAQPASVATSELRETIAAWRGMFELIELQLSMAPVETREATVTVEARRSDVSSVR